MKRKTQVTVHYKHSKILMFKINNKNYKNNTQTFNDSKYLRRI